MTDIKKTLRQSIDDTLSKLDIQGEYSLEFTSNQTHGDLSTNVAMVAALQVKDTFESPRALAEEVRSYLEKNQEVKKFISHIKIEGPGFINFFLSKEYLLKTLGNVLQEKEKFGASLKNKGLLALFEFADPNPFKEFHIGHLYTSVVGESLSRLFEFQGADVKRVCYQGDVGLHVAKAVFGILQKKSEFEEIKKKSIDEKAKFLGEAYALGAGSYEESDEAKQEMNSLNKKIYERTDSEINTIYDHGKTWSLEYFETIYKRLGIHFLRFYFESEVGKIGAEYVRENINKVFEADQGAVIFPGKKYGLHNRVFINSLGLPTYEAKELGLAPLKYKEFSYDVSVIVTGNEINEYFKVLFKALSLISPELAEKTHHISHGMVRLPSGKMSSRTGDIVTGEWMLDEAKAKITKAYPEMDGATAEKVAVGAVKYALLRSGIGQDIKFSFEESISLEGNSGPYLQYTYARTQSVLEKAQISVSKENFHDNDFEPEEESILRALFQFPDVALNSASRYSPNVVASYLFELSQKFNLFYQKHTILGDKEKKEFRLAVTSAVGHVLQNGLYLLGIEAPEKM